MNKKPHQRLLDGMPPHIADKVDKMIGNMKEVYELAMESWEGCDGCTEGDKHFFINGYMKGYNRAMRDDQPRLMYRDGSEIRKVQSKHTKYPELEGLVNLCDEIISERDADIFIDGITNPKAPSESLEQAVLDYQSHINFRTMKGNLHKTEEGKWIVSYLEKSRFHKAKEKSLPVLQEEFILNGNQPVIVLKEGAAVEFEEIQGRGPEGFYSYARLIEPKKLDIDTIRELIGKYPNDSELGYKVRDLFNKK